MLVFGVLASLAAAVGGAPAAYDEALAVADLWLNQASGCLPVSNIANWTCGLACEKEKLDPSALKLAENKSAASLAITARRGDECMLILRGSKNVWNTLEDLDFFPKDLAGCAGCKVHSGFYDTWLSLQPQVFGDLSALGCEGLPLSLNGHSLGGAMAVIAGYHIAGEQIAKTHTWKLQRLYTYGQPRAGNDKFAAAFDARVGKLGVPHYRVVDYRDAVPHLPLANMFWEGWQHTGMEVYYNATRTGAIAATCTTPDDKRCSAQWDLFQTITHACDHCSYLGINPCDCNEDKPQCEDHAALMQPRHR